jgi:WD40 repeat protein
VAIGNIGGDVVVVDLSETAAPIHLKHTGMLQTMAWTPDSRNLLTGGLGSLQMWELSTSAALTRRRLRDPDLSLPLTPLAISPNGELLAVDAREAQQVKLVDVESGRTTQTLACDTISSAYQLQFSPDGRRLARLDHTRLTVWDLASGERTVEFDSGFTSGRSLFSLGFAADGRVQAGGTSEFVPAVWDVTQPKVIWTGERTPGAVVMLSPDGQLAAAFMAVATSEAESIPVYEVASGERRFTFPGAPRRTMQSMGIVSDDSRWLLAVHSQSEAAAGLNAVMMSFGGEQGAALASIEDNPWLGDIWNLQTGERHLRFSGPSAARSYQFSPDGRYLALVLQNGSVQVWQVERGEELFYWRPASSRSGAEFAPRQVRFTHDSKSLVVADPDRPIVHLLHLDILNDELQSLSLDWQEDAE